MRSAIVVGGGVSGLAAAAEFHRQGVQVKVLERRDQVGGVIRSIRREGFLIESGPSEMLVKSEAMLDLLNAYGLSSQIVHSNPTSRKRYIVKRGRPLPVPMSPWEAVTTPLFSLKGKLRLLREPFVANGNREDETIAAFVERRVGQEFLQYAVGPLTSGIFAGDPNHLSMRHAFPKIWNLEANYGGLIKGSLALARDRKRSGAARWRNQLISFKDGMQQLPRALAGLLPVDAIRLGAKDITVEKSKQWEVGWRDSNGEHTERADALVLALPAHSVTSLSLPREIGQQLSVLADVEYPQVSVVTLGFRRDSIRHPLDGFGLLSPQVEKRRILGALFLSSLFPERAPDEYLSLLVFAGGATAPDLAALPTARLIPMIMEELDSLLGVSGEPVLVNHHYWRQAIPQYTVGYQRFLNAIDATERANPGLAVVGNFRGGPGVGDCLENATAAAQQIMQTLYGT